MSKKKTIVLSIVGVILAAVIAGGLYVYNYINEQNTIRRNKEIEVEYQKKTAEYFKSEFDSIIFGPYRYYDYRNKDGAIETNWQTMGAVFFVVKPSENYRIYLVDYDGNIVSDDIIAVTARYMLKNNLGKTTLNHKIERTINYETVSFNLRVLFMERIDGPIPDSVKNAKLIDNDARYFAPTKYGASYGIDSYYLEFNNGGYRVNYYGKIAYSPNKNSSLNPQVNTDDYGWLMQKTNDGWKENNDNLIKNIKNNR